MRGRSWKSFAAQAATSRFNSFKGYLAQQDLKNTVSNAIQRQIGSGNDRSRADARQGWREWAGQKISRGPGNPGTEKIALFPGWAARRFPQSARDESFHVDVICGSTQTRDRASEDISTAPLRLTPSTEDLLKTVELPPRPAEMTEEREMEMLEQQFRRMNAQKEGSIDSQSFISRSSSPERDSRSTYEFTAREASSDTRDPFTTVAAMSDELLRKLHDNLEARLRPFWSSVVPGRTVRVHLFASPSGGGDTGAIPAGVTPLATQEVQTAADGSFQMMFHVHWERMCQHPAALHIAFGEPSVEHDFIVAAELLPVARLRSASFADLKEAESELSVPPATASIRLPLTHSPIRVVSDIDDTVKHSNIPAGAREVFRNVFVKELEDLIIPGMGEWYTSMWKKGVRFHYVSNGPFELLPILGDFFQVSGLPPGSVKLKSYAGRSLFTGLLSAPAAKKRAGVQEIIDAFPDSQFLLIGDTGEQDLELYADLARERPEQILGVFIRDTGTGDPLEDPIGFRIGIESFSNPESTTPYIPENIAPSQRRTSTEDRGKRLPPIDTSYIVRQPRSRSSKTPSTAPVSNLNGSGDYFTPMKITDEPDTISMYDGTRNTSMTSLASGYVHKTPSTASSGYFPLRTPKSAATATSASTRIPEAERKRHELQMRVYRARANMPEHVTLRVFRSPTECVETQAMLSGRS
ncbi:hypothetical protein VNI00_009284 [Paramarasmius palmivorus]|uniref:Phosphatidate phosphatase APP1 catalytic domain-containing protein n=1 Tax=Paramarasmius palmivorus TaxID=297713 RepID=A0AAW0CS32_9AGAR